MAMSKKPEGIYIYVYIYAIYRSMASWFFEKINRNNIHIPQHDVKFRGSSFSHDLASEAFAQPRVVPPNQRILAGLDTWLCWETGYNWLKNSKDSKDKLVEKIQRLKRCCEISEMGLTENRPQNIPKTHGSSSFSFFMAGIHCRFLAPFQDTARYWDETSTRWCPPVISWFISPINYRYIYHKPWLLEL